MSAYAPAAERAIISDDGCSIRATLYRGSSALAVVVLDPAAAVRLAGRLIEAAAWRLDAARGAPDTPPPRRGGDRLPDRRRRRNEGLRDLAALLGADLSLEQRAAEVIAKAGRYRPAQLDASGSTERQALRRISDAGLPLPGRRQLRRILTRTGVA